MPSVHLLEQAGAPLFPPRGLVFRQRSALEGLARDFLSGSRFSEVALEREINYLLFHVRRSERLRPNRPAWLVTMAGHFFCPDIGMFVYKSCGRMGLTRG